MGADIEVLREDLDAADDMFGLLEMVNYNMRLNCRLTCFSVFEYRSHKFDVCFHFSRVWLVQIRQKLLMRTR